MEDMKTGYIVEIIVGCDICTFFSKAPNLILEDAKAICESSMEDCMEEHTGYELISMKRIKYIEED